MDDANPAFWKKYCEKDGELFKEFMDLPGGLNCLIHKDTSFENRSKPLDHHYQNSDPTAVEFLESLRKADRIMDEYLKNKEEFLITSFTLPAERQEDSEWFFERIFSGVGLELFIEKKFGIKYNQKKMLLKTLGNLREAYLEK